MQIYLAKQESRIVIALTLSKLKIGIMEKLGRKNRFFSLISSHKGIESLPQTLYL